MVEREFVGMTIVPMHVVLWLLICAARVVKVAGVPTGGACPTRKRVRTPSVKGKAFSKIVRKGRNYKHDVTPDAPEVLAAATGPTNETVLCDNGVRRRQRTKLGMDLHNYIRRKQVRTREAARKAHEEDLLAMVPERKCIVCDAFLDGDEDACPLCTSGGTGSGAQSFVCLLWFHQHCD